MINISSYLKIINHATLQNRKKLKRGDPNYVYYEEHHILPKSIFTDQEKDKRLKVLLTPKEHLLAHLFLCEIFKNDSTRYAKCMYALRQMTCTKYNKGNHIRFLEEDYQYVLKNFEEHSNVFSKMREDFARIHSSRHISDKTRAKMSAWQKGRLLTEEHKLNIKEAMKGRTLSDTHKKNLAINKIGNKNGTRTLLPAEILFIDKLLTEYKSVIHVQQEFKKSFGYGRPKLIFKYVNSKSL